MARSFQELKRTSAERFERLQSLIRPNLGSHRRTRLRVCGESGSLLHKGVAQHHGTLLFEDYQKKLGGLVRDEAQERLRFLTVLHSVTSLNKKDVMRAVVNMEAALHRCFDGSGAWLLGAVEIEVVNVALLRRIGSLKKDETRKLDVLERLADRNAIDTADNGALVHFHGIVDLGGGNSSLREAQLRRNFKKLSVWQRSPYQVELKRHFKKRTVAQNLKGIASYITKGGNEELRYKAGFGRDLLDDLEAKMWRAGNGRADKGGETVTDERGLSIAEIAFLDSIWLELMDRKKDQRGYLVRVG
jgi:hypothetical protein